MKAKFLQGYTENNRIYETNSVFQDSQPKIQVN
jgi:hypothetical protein